MSNTVELVTKLRDQLSGPLQRQAALLGTWQAKVVACAAAAVGAGVAIAGMTAQAIRFADRLTEPLSRLNDLAVGLQVSQSELASLQYVINQAGGDSENMGPIFQRMRDSIAGAGEAGSEAAIALDKLGLSQEQLLAMNPIQQYTAISGALSTYAGTAEQSNIAQALLGRGAVQLRGSLNLTSNELTRGMEAARELGVVLDDEAYAAADRFQDGLKTIKDQFNVLLMEGLEPSLPKLLELLDSFMVLAETVLPTLIDSAGDAVQIFGDVVSVFAAVQDVINSVPILKLGQDLDQSMTGWEHAANATIPGLGTQLMLMRNIIDGLSPSEAAAAEQTDIFAAALDTVRDAANQAEAELAVYQNTLDLIEQNRQAKKSETAPTHDTGAGSVADDVEVTLTAEEMKLEAATTRIDAIKGMEVERIQMLEAAEMESAARLQEVADRAAAKQEAVELELKNIRLRAEQAVAAAREQAIARGIDQTVQFGMTMIHAGLEGQESWDQFWNNFAMRMFDMVMSEAFGMLLQVLTGGGAGFFGSLFGSLFSHGGTVPQHAVSGLTVGGSHYGDRVPAMLEPGERVLTRGEARDYSGGGARGNISVALSLGSMFSSASRSDLLRAGKVLRQVMEAEGLA